MVKNVLVVFLLLFVLPLASSWTQQYCDSASTNYVNYTGGNYAAEWNITVHNNSGSSPSVSDKGVLFYPLLGAILAVAPNGKILWNANLVPLGLPNYLSNTLYSKKHDYVIVGGLAQTDSYAVLALRASDGSVVWKVNHRQLSNPQTLSISPESDAVFISKNTTAVALKLRNGRLLWNSSDIRKLGIFMQTKVGFMNAKTDEQNQMQNNELLILPTLANGGRLLAHSIAVNETIWYAKVKYGAGALFAFSSQFGMIFGLAGGRGGIFGVDSRNGSVLFNSAGYCSLWLAGPVVDDNGYAYYSCGNRVYSVNADGSLRWISNEYGPTPPNYGVLTPPSIHPKGYVFIVHYNHTVVLAFSTADGSLYKSYDVPHLLYLEPLILVGDTLMYLMGYSAAESSDTTICAMKLDLI